MPGYMYAWTMNRSIIVTHPTVMPPNKFAQLDQMPTVPAIYQKCELKWRKHGPSAIDNCSRMEENYYRDKGMLRN